MWWPSSHMEFDSLMPRQTRFSSFVTTLLNWVGGGGCWGWCDPREHAFFCFCFFLEGGICCRSRMKCMCTSTAVGGSGTLICFVFIFILHVNWCISNLCCFGLFTMLIKLFFVLSWSILLSYFYVIFLLIKDTLLCRRLLHNNFRDKL